MTYPQPHLPAPARGHSRSRGALRGVLLLCVLVWLGGCAQPVPRAGLEEDIAAHVARSRQGSDPLLRHNERLRAARDVSVPVAAAPADPAGGRLRAVRLDPRAAASEPGRRAAQAQASGAAAEEEERFRVDIDFQDVALSELVELLFRDYLEQPYTVVDTFKDRKVNFFFHGEVTRTQLMQMLESLLVFHGAFVRYSNGIYVVAADASKPVAQFAPGALGGTTAGFRLRYINAADFLLVARQFLSEPKQAIAMASGNLLVVTAPQPEVEAVRRLQEVLDLPYFEGKYLLLYTTRSLSAQALKALLDKYLASLVSVGKGQMTPVETDVVPTRNQLVAVAQSQQSKWLVEDFLERVDTPASDQRQTFQYALSNQQPKEVAGTLKSVTASLFGADQRIEIVADEGSGSLFIVARPEQFAELTKVLHRLDYRPSAAHIDVTLLEVVLNDNLRFGVEWFLDQVSSGFIADVAVNLGNPLLAGAVGLDAGIVSLSSNKFFAFQLLEGETSFKILSNPQVIVKNGATAIVNVGREVSIVNSQLQTDTAGSVSQTSFQRRDVAIVVEVTPRIGADGTVLINLKLRDERDAGVDSNNQPIFSKRELTTELVARDGETVFIGGIIQERDNARASKIPLLGDVPVVQHLFRNDDRETERTELVVFLTPRVILDSVGTELLSRALLSARSAAAPAAAAAPGGG